MGTPDLRILLIPVLSGLIGWFTNFLAIKLLFWPHEAVVIPITNFKIQGLLSRRKPEIAKTLSRVISEELITRGNLASEIDRDGVITDIRKSVDEHVENRMEKRLSFLPTVLRKRVSEVLRQAVGREVSISLNKNFDIVVDNLTAKIDISALIEKEVLALDTREIEWISFRLAKRELTFIKKLGGILGFIIGLFQVGFIYIIY